MMKYSLVTRRKLLILRYPKFLVVFGDRDRENISAGKRELVNIWMKRTVRVYNVFFGQSV